MDRKFAVIGFALFIMGCTTTQEIKRPDGQTEYLIACGASLGWNVCYTDYLHRWDVAQLLRDAGAKQVTVLRGEPPIKAEDFPGETAT